MCSIKVFPKTITIGKVMKSQCRVELVCCYNEYNVRHCWRYKGESNILWLMVFAANKERGAVAHGHVASSWPNYLEYGRYRLLHAYSCGWSLPHLTLFIFRSHRVQIETAAPLMKRLLLLFQNTSTSKSCYQSNLHATL